VTAIENACPKFRVSPPAKNWGPQNHLSRRLRNLTATVTAYIFGTKDDISNWARIETVAAGRGSEGEHAPRAAQCRGGISRGENMEF